MKIQFVHNQTFYYNPGGQWTDQINIPGYTPSGPTPGSQGRRMQDFAWYAIRANDIQDIYAECDGRNLGPVSDNGDRVNMQDITQSQTPGVGPGTDVDAEGLNTWKNRYKYCTVLKSKLTLSIKTTGSAQPAEQEPCLAWICKNAEGLPKDMFTTDSTINGAQTINERPFVTKALINGSNLTSGATLSQTYTARKMEGVTNILGNDAYRGQMIPYVPPTEQTQFVFGFCNARGSAHQPMMKETTPNQFSGQPKSAPSTPPLQIQVKVVYTCMLTEPQTDENPPPGPAGVPAIMG